MIRNYETLTMKVTERLGDKERNLHLFIYTEYVKLHFNVTITCINSVTFYYMSMNMIFICIFMAGVKEY